jgi:hypothetical protein
MRTKISVFLFNLLVCIAFFAGAVNAAEDRRADYYYKVVEKALEAVAADYPPYEFKRPPHMTHSRVVAEMESGGSREWGVFPFNPELGKKLILIDIPVAKGILGYRVFLIRKDAQEKLRAVNTLEDLKALRLGAGQDWNITRIFRAAGFNIVTGASYEGLFEMLLNDRFDYFPRGVNEIIDEYEQRKAAMPDLAIDEAVLLYTPLPVFIYVAPTKPELAKRLREGLERMKADGSFDALFMAEHGPLIERLQLNRRKVFRIPNPALAGMDILNRKDLWYVIE